ncbi:Putative glycosyl transferase, family 2 (modular protein) [uncultured Stenotrophomonas sp.]|uniref:Putative glycosyl transferase, family 2 (Modular protein) n=1 Tax=uncultured Stenotrophomonas sp. TaxID=165438 RepID=A0A1Y5Q7X1_9GAMM|nr:Putative glycosyl transferase, family 2 (modular protein) [uncultured Stenotrophomonas sp.]
MNDMNIPMAKPSVLLVLGMHRSGTSALAGTFSQLGLRLGDELMPATADANPKGYFEHVRVVQAHDRLLAAFGMDWADPRALPESWMRHPATLQVRAELEQLLLQLLAAGETVVVKDPRLCRFVPLWRELLAGLGVRVHFAFIARHPVEVAASLRRRDGMSEYRAGLLSLAYQLEAEQATRGASRLFMTYEDLIADWRGQVARCRLAFGEDVLPESSGEAAVDGFLDAQLRNHRASEVHALEPEVVEAYRCFQLAAGPGTVELPPLMDALRERFEAGRRGYAAATEATLAALAVDHARHVPAWSRGLELASAWGSPLLDVPPATAPRLYVRAADGAYSEERAAEGVIDMRPDGVCVATMALAADLPLERVRFDPDGRAGVYELLTVTLDGIDVGALADRVTAMHEHRLAVPTAGMVAWAAQGEDPWLELDLSDLPVVSGGEAARSISFRFRRVTASSLAEAGNAERHVQQAAALDALHQSVGGLGGSLTRMLEANSGLLQQAHAAQSGFMQQAHAAHDARLDVLTAQLGALSGAVMELKHRSDRPLLYRLNRKRQARRLRNGWRSAGWSVVPEPLANVARSADGQWCGSHRDPQFLLQVEGARGEALAAIVQPGWYVLTLDGRVHAGRLENPCLYPDYGRGMPDSDRIGLLPYDASGCSETALYLGPGLRSLRLDPSDEDACFDIGVQLRPVARPTAWLHMLRRVCRAQGGGPKVAARLSWTMLAAGFRAGPGAMRRQCLADYQALQPGLSSDYARWLGRNEPVLAAAEVESRLAALPRRPRLSVLMPVYEAPERWLRCALDSVARQHYPDWELCVADDASPSPHVRKVLEEYQHRDPRIKVVHRQKNGHISASSNSALEAATGEYMVLLDHDDELHPEALLLVAEAIGRAPDAQLIYSDEDKIDEAGNRFDPYFKPDWNYDLFLGQNCVSHLGVYALPLVRALGGFREGLEGSQDWDLALRCVERIAPQQIVHIPRILYHWRAIQGSTALAAGEKNYAVLAGRRAVAEHLQRTGQAAEVSILPASMLRVKRAMPVPVPKVSLVIPTRDRVDLLRMCVDSILERSSYPDYEILVVDNGSVEPATLEYFARISALANVRVLAYPGEFNYSAINNFAVAQARGEVIGLVNNDIEVISADWMEEMVAHAMRPDVGAVGAMLYYPDDTIQHAGVLVGLCGVAGHIGSRHPRGSQGYFGRLLLAQELTAVTAACLLVRKSVYDEVGGLDERLRVAFNDVDLCLRIRRKGYRNLWTPFAELYHHESASRGLEDNPVKQARFMSEVEFMRKRWGDALQGDPAYNPNLSLSLPFVLES